MNLRSASASVEAAFDEKTSKDIKMRRMVKVVEVAGGGDGLAIVLKFYGNARGGGVRALLIKTAVVRQLKEKVLVWV